MPSSSTGCEPEVLVEGCKAKAAPASGVQLPQSLQIGLNANSVSDVEDTGSRVRSYHHLVTKIYL